MLQLLGIISSRCEPRAQLLCTFTLLIAPMTLYYPLAVTFSSVHVIARNSHISVSRNAHTAHYLPTLNERAGEMLFDLAHARANV